MCTQQFKYSPVQTQFFYIADLMFLNSISLWNGALTEALYSLLLIVTLEQLWRIMILPRLAS